VKGSYILLISLPSAETIEIGSLSQVCFPGGCYAYVGSALNGLAPRLRRHLNDQKKRHWHIDHLLQKASIREIVVGVTDSRAECALARALGAQFDSIPGFGSSDCRCPSHLFFTEAEAPLKSAVIRAITKLDIAPELMVVGDQPD
jgi:Uri superfamily endonuclease